MDSMKDLPENWKEIDLRERYGIANPDQFEGQPDSGVSESDGVTTDSEEENRPEASDSEDSGQLDDNVDTTVDAHPNKAPKRVLVFSTVLLLGLLSMCRWGSVDGTFKASTKRWKQLFVMLCNYDGTWIPIAFGWLPDKSLLSYQIFLMLVMECFLAHSAEIQVHFGRSALKMKKVKMDFELNIIKAFGVLFKIKGCLFHFSQAGKIQ